VRKIDPVALLKEFVVAFKDRGNDWVTVQCPYHNDSDDLEKAHGGINKLTGGFNCFSCGHDNGGVLGFLSVKMGVPEQAVLAYHDNIFGTNNKVDNESDVALCSLCHDNLLGCAEMLQQVYNKHGITTETVKKFKLGRYPQTGRLTIPIFDNEGKIGDIRQYKYGALGDGEGKIVSRKGAKTLLFATCNIDEHDVIYITEGEMKAMLLWQNGFAAVSPTHGATSWSAAFTHRLRGKDIVLVYDIDKPGRKNAEKRCIDLHRHVKTVKNVFLVDVEDIENGDVTDYFVKKQKTVDDFKSLVETTPCYTPYEQKPVTEEDVPPVKVPLAASSKAELNGKRILTECVISAKDTSPYIIPKKLRVRCSRSKDYCTNCRVYDKPDDTTFEYDADSAKILDLVVTKGSKEAVKDLHIKQSGIYRGCKIADFDELESYNVEELRVIPQLAVGHATDEQVTRRVFYVGNSIATNSSYMLSARVAPMPGDGHATLVVYNADPTVDNLDNFSTTEDLSVFKTTENTVEAVEAKLNHIYSDFESNVTRIKMRKDLHLVYDLAFHSVLYIPYEGRNVKGWADVLVIGDSGQGKSEASSRMSQHYRAGERVDSKRASVAGIVGGLQETNKRWFITWGTIPLNDRRLVILEEVKGMGVGELTKLTDMRSSGFAEIHKIERAKTYARTRLIWISNPRSDSKISTYNYGVDAVRELIGSLEDIRRFDIVAAVASGEVPYEVINSAHLVTTDHVYTTTKCSELVQWAWSRKERNIQVGADTITEALAAASRLSNQYSSACPIVEPSDQRLKMLRLATAVAARVYSTEDGENLVVLPCHVQVIERLMNRLYKTKALGYYEFSNAAKNEEAINDANAVTAAINTMPHAADAARCVLEADTLRTDDIVNFTDWPLDRASEFIGTLVRAGAVKRSKRGGYRKTSAFIDVLKQMVRSGVLTNESLKEKLQKDSEL
jgi:hypothetical protein